MTPADRAIGPCALLAILASCASEPPIQTAGPGEALDAAGALLEQDRADTARTVLNRIDPDELLGTERERYDLLWATALHRTGDSYDAFKVIRDFADEHRFSELASQVEELHYRIGADLAASDASYFIFGSDKEDAEIVLREFVERYGGNPHVPDALRALGDLAYEEERFLEARRRFEQIAQDHPASEWVPYARYRIAMCAYRSLVGPAYDFEQMRRGRNELRDYLTTDPERPEFRETGSEALAIVEGWIRQRYWLNARFYRTVESPTGERHQLEALVREYPESELAERARRRLEELATPPAVAGEDSSP